MIRVFEKASEWRAFRPSLNGSLGFVPTMGALHPGHASLVERSHRENAFTLVSIFVNPTQFNDPKDLEKYPRTLDADLKLLKGAGADFVFYPRYEEIYADQYRYKVVENELSRILCGAHRAGHFDGVLTVVMKLLNIAQAQNAYFGEKDYQQLQLVRGMVDTFFMPTKIVGCPIVREKDGLAMSSRNVRLAPAERERAPLFSQILRKASDAQSARVELEKAGFVVDYVEDRFGRRLGAVKLGEVRLIDNVEI